MTHKSKNRRYRKYSDAWKQCHVNGRRSLEFKVYWSASYNTTPNKFCCCSHNASQCCICDALIWQCPASALSSLVVRVIHWAKNFSIFVFIPQHLCSRMQVLEPISPRPSLPSSPHCSSSHDSAHLILSLICSACWAVMKHMGAQAPASYPWQLCWVTPKGMPLKNPSAFPKWVVCVSVWSGSLCKLHMCHCCHVCCSFSPIYHSVTYRLCKGEQHLHGSLSATHFWLNGTTYSINQMVMCINLMLFTVTREHKLQQQEQAAVVRKHLNVKNREMEQANLVI